MVILRSAINLANDTKLAPRNNVGNFKQVQHSNYKHIKVSRYLLLIMIITVNLKMCWAYPNLLTRKLHNYHQVPRLKQNRYESPNSVSHLSNPLSQMGSFRYPKNDAVKMSYQQNYPKVYPFVVKEYYPNVPELNEAASGPLDSPIVSERFEEKLVYNKHPRISFRDSRDRLMSKTCDEKLNMLIMIVEFEWPNASIYVLRGRTFTPPQMAHTNTRSEFSRERLALYAKGRALDITVKEDGYVRNGLLAALARVAGFSWIHYRDRSHVHVSVKPDLEDQSKDWNSVN